MHSALGFEGGHEILELLSSQLFVRDAEEIFSKTPRTGSNDQEFLEDKAKAPWKLDYFGWTLSC